MLLDHFDFGSFKFTFDEFALFNAFLFRKMLLNSFKYQNTKVLAAAASGQDLARRPNLTQPKKQESNDH
jgi:hypothetical protein